MLLKVFSLQGGGGVGEEKSETSVRIIALKQGESQQSTVSLRVKNC